MSKMERSKEVEWNYIPTKEDILKMKFKKNHLQLSWDWVFHTIQWEWPYIWTPSTFIRLNQCNLSCKNCDTPYTFRRDMKEFYEGYNISAIDLVAEIEKAREVKKVSSNVIYNIVITGWEPLLQMTWIEELIDLLPWNANIQIETNWTIYPTEKILNVCEIICSPKLKSFNENLSLYREKVLRKLSDKCSFKFVCASENDIEEVMEFIDKYYIDIWSVYIMPEGITMEDNHKSFQWMIKKILEYWLMVTPRLQNIIWEGAERGI